MQQLILDIRPDAPPSFANFMPGHNREAVAALLDFSTAEGGESLLYLWGEAGCGKSHLLQACVSAARQAGRNARYLAAQADLPDDLDGLLAVDEAERLDETGQIALFNLINRAREGEGRLVVAGSLPPARLPMRPDLVTRLGWGLVFALQRLDEAERAAAIRERAQARGMSLSDEVVGYMLSHCRRDLPSLLATVDALDAYSLSLKRPPTLPLLRTLLQGH